MRIKHVVLAVSFGVFIAACENDIDDLEPLVVGDYKSGILISNEGPFNDGTGTVSFISEDLTTERSEIYKTVNGEDLGNVVNSIGFADTEAYIIANVSNTIAVVNRDTFEKIAVISEDLYNPRNFVFANGKGYVTNWGDPNVDTDDYVAVIDLTSYEVEKMIAVDFGPEELIVRQNTIYVAHKGGYGQNNVLTVINAESDVVVSTITVGDMPSSMQFDDQGNLWVLSKGKPSFTGEETQGSISKISTSSNSVLSSLEFTTTEHPDHLSYDGTSLYYNLSGAVYSMLPSATILPTERIFEDLNIYKMTVLDDRLYITDAKDFASNGSLSIYDLNSKEEIMTFEVGLIPGGIYFNQ